MCLYVNCDILQTIRICSGYHQQSEGYFDITATNQNYGAQFNADYTVSYTMVFEYEIMAGTWSQLGSTAVSVTATGTIDLDVQMGTLSIGTSYPGRVLLYRDGSLRATKNGTFRGPPAPPGP